jgi:hypothetical protein
VAARNALARRLAGGLAAGRDLVNGNNDVVVGGQSDDARCGHAQSLPCDDVATLLRRGIEPSGRFLSRI